MPTFTGMKGFIIILLGQVVSVTGSGLTRFGLGVWILDQTGSATQYSLFLFMFMMPASIVALVAGPLVDRWDRRRILIASDTVAALSTAGLLILFFTDHLQIWHIFVMAAVNSNASAFQVPAFQASVPMLVPRERLGQAAGMSQLVQALDSVVSPALAGILILSIGLGGIMVVDLSTFSIGILMLFLVAIPRPRATAEVTEARSSLWQEFLFGLRYIRERPGFIYLMTYVTLIAFFLGFAMALFTPMILSFADAQLLGFVSSLFGIGTLTGGVALTVWGGPRRRITGILVSGLLFGLGLTMTGINQSPLFISGGLFLAGGSSTMLIGLNRAIYQAKTAPDVLGRIFSVRILLSLSAMATAVLIAGPLATTVFEPLLTTDGLGVDSLGRILGSGPGRGMGLMFIVTGLLMIMVTLIFMAIPAFRNMEESLPDQVDSNTDTNR